MTPGIFDETRVSLVLAGGVGLGAYQGGAYAVLHEHAALRPAAIAGSSIGAVNAAVIAGAAVDTRVQHLSDLWKRDSNLTPFAMPEAPLWQRWNHIQKWTSALTTRLMGATGHFHPRVQTAPWDDFASLYDLAPLRTRLERLSISAGSTPGKPSLVSQ